LLFGLAVHIARITWNDEGRDEHALKKVYRICVLLEILFVVVGIFLSTTDPSDKVNCAGIYPQARGNIQTLSKPNCHQSRNRAGNRLIMLNIQTLQHRPVDSRCNLFAD